jgi:hypothetical protein
MFRGRFTNSVQVTADSHQHLRKLGAAVCESGLRDQTPEHILQTCPIVIRALLAGANNPQDQVLGHSGRPAENNQ